MVKVTLKRNAEQIKLWNGNEAFRRGDMLVCLDASNVVLREFDWDSVSTYEIKPAVKVSAPTYGTIVYRQQSEPKVYGGMRPRM